MNERMARVSEEMRAVIAVEVLRLKDPRIGFVTITKMDVAPDLRHAVVWYSVYGDEKEKKGTRAALRSARSRLRAALGKQVRVKYTPDLEFREDMGLEHLQRVGEVLQQVEHDDEDDSTGRTGDTPEAAEDA